MGWPQQIEVRLDGALVERFTVGEPPEGAQPATRSHAGAGFGDREWEEFMQLLGDAFLEVRVPVTAGPHIVGVSFLRELWEPEWVQQPLQRGRPLAVDERYMGYAAVGLVDIQGPYEASGVPRTLRAGKRYSCATLSPVRRRKRVLGRFFPVWRGGHIVDPRRTKTCEH